MRRIFVALLFLVSSVSLSSIACAEKMKEPEVDYSGVIAIETEMSTVEGRVYYSRGKERREMTIYPSGIKQIIISRMNKKVIWELMPDIKMYTEIPEEGRKAFESISNMDVEQSVVGNETVNGVKTTKHKMIAKRKDGTKLNGYIWLTKERILVKSDITTQNSSGKKVRIKMELEDLKIGKQERSLFEVPAGYKKLGD